MSLFIYGVHPVEEALRHVPNGIKTLFVRRDHRDPHKELVAQAESLGIKIQRITLESFDTRSRDGNHQGIAVELDAFPYRGLSDILEWTADQSTGLVVILDGIEDPHNLGAVLRSAAAMGASAVIFGKNRAAAVTPPVVRSSAGLAFAVPVVRVTNIARTIKELADHGWWSVGGVLDGAPIWTHKLDRKIAIVVGGEGTGVRRLVAESCDMLASIPMTQEVESVNVSVAAAVLMYEWLRQVKVSGGR